MKELRFALAGALGRGMFRMIMSTVRFEVENEGEIDPLEMEPVIFCLWHGRLLPLTYYHRDNDITAIISQSRDGEYIARVVEGWGYNTVRGSTSRGGGEALRGLVKAAREGHSLAITPDGPRGPRQKLQPGVLTVAQLTGVPIIPLTAGCSRAWWPGSWDRFCIPKPFARVRIRYGKPLRIPRTATEAELREHGQALEAKLNALTRELDADGGPDR